MSQDIVAEGIDLSLSLERSDADVAVHQLLHFLDGGEILECESYT